MKQDTVTHAHPVPRKIDTPLAVRRLIKKKKKLS